MAKNFLFEYSEMTGSDRVSKRVAAAFARAGANVIKSEVDHKVKRTAGITYKDLNLSFADGQQIVFAVKMSGDIAQAKLNGKAIPIKNQDDHAKAIGELVRAMDQGRAKFQKKLALQRAELPKGIKTAAPKMEAALQTRLTALDEAIADKKREANELRAELGEPAMDSIDAKLAALKERRDPDGTGDRNFDLALAQALANQIITQHDTGAVLDGVSDLSLARLELEKGLYVVETNLPFSIERGDEAQAALQRESIVQFKAAIAILDGAGETEGEDGEADPNQEGLFDAAEAFKVSPQMEEEWRVKNALEAALRKRNDTRTPNSIGDRITRILIAMSFERSRAKYYPKELMKDAEQVLKDVEAERKGKSSVFDDAPIAATDPIPENGEVPPEERPGFGMGGGSPTAA